MPAMALINGDVSKKVKEDQKTLTDKMNEAARHEFWDCVCCGIRFPHGSERRRCVTCHHLCCIPCTCDYQDSGQCHSCRQRVRQKAGIHCFSDCSCYIARMFTRSVPFIEIWLWQRTETEHGVFPAVKFCFQIDDPMKLFQFELLSAEVHAAVIDTRPETLRGKNQ